MSPFLKLIYIRCPPLSPLSLNPHLLRTVRGSRFCVHWNEVSAAGRAAVQVGRKEIPSRSALQLGDSERIIEWIKTLRI